MPREESFPNPLPLSELVLEAKPCPPDPFSLSLTFFPPRCPVIAVNARISSVGSQRDWPFVGGIIIVAFPTLSSVLRLMISFLMERP